MTAPAATYSSVGPILRWAGSKRQILALLAAYWSERQGTYYEPFCGSLSLFLHLAPAKAHLSDLNKDLIETYNTVRTNPTSVARHLAGLDCSESAYYQIRARFPLCVDSIERAALFIYLNRLCFNGLYRTNSKGYFNVPYGGGGNASKPPDEAAITNFASRINGATIVCMDFEAALKTVRPGDFVYLDPPYSVNATRVFKEYLPAGFGSDDLTRLRSCLERLDEIGATFLLSYADTEEAAALARGFTIHRSRVNRLIAASSANRQSVLELLISNHPVPPSIRSS